MKPPSLPGMEKFRFCDKKYEQHKEIQKHQRMILDSLDGAQNDHKNVEEDKEAVDFLLGITGHCISSDSLSLHSSMTTDDEQHHKHLKAKSRNDLAHQKSYDSISTVSSTLDEILSQMNINGYLNHHRHYGRHIHKRKPNLPISTRMTSRVFNLTSYIKHLSDEDDDDEVVEEDGDDEDEESDSFGLEDNVKDIVYSSKMIEKPQTTIIAKKSSSSLESSKMLSEGTAKTRNRSTEKDTGSALLSRSPTPNSIVSHDGSDTSSSDGSIEKHLRTPLDKHHYIHHRHNIDPLLHAHHTHQSLILPAPSHASLMSDESSSSISLSTNREEFEDSSLRSSSCSPIVEHWAKNCSAIPQEINGIAGNGIVGGVRLSTLSHSSWEEEDNP